MRVDEIDANVEPPFDGQCETDESQPYQHDSGVGIRGRHGKGYEMTVYEG